MIRGIAKWIPYIIDLARDPWAFLSGRDICYGYWDPHDGSWNFAGCEYKMPLYLLPLAIIAEKLIRPIVFRLGLQYNYDWDQ